MVIGACCRTSAWTLFRTSPRYARSSGRYSPYPGFPRRPTGTLTEFPFVNAFFTASSLPHTHNALSIFKIETGAFAAWVTLTTRINVPSISSSETNFHSHYISYYQHLLLTLCVCPQINISQTEYTNMMSAYLQQLQVSSDANSIPKLFTFDSGWYQRSLPHHNNQLKICIGSRGFLTSQSPCGRKKSQEIHVCNYFAQAFALQFPCPR